MNSHVDSANLLEYFRALRTEIIEAQKLRVQVGIAKTVFLGTLLGFFFKDAKGDLAILVCPFVALMFDCMVYGLSFNIRDLGCYIADYIEPNMVLGEESWQCYRKKRVTGGFRDWGRMAWRVGTYGLSSAVTVVAFVEVRPAVGTPLLWGAWIWRITLMVLLAVSRTILIFAEFPSTIAVPPSKESGTDHAVRSRRVGA